jgi:hypothetical protein
MPPVNKETSIAGFFINCTEAGRARVDQIEDKEDTTVAACGSKPVIWLFYTGIISLNFRVPDLGPSTPNESGGPEATAFTFCKVLQAGPEITA